MKKEIKLLFVLLSFIFISLSFISAGELRVTQEHPFLVNGSWISASDLNVADILQTVDGKKVRITKISDFISKDNFSVYNLEAGIYHDFVVNGGDDFNVVVHNSDAISSGVCFSGDTLISMADGTKKPIKTIQSGESILSYNLLNNSFQTSTVYKISRHLSNDLYLINNKTIVTSGHPFWTKELGWAAINDSEIREHPELRLSKLVIGLNFLGDSGNYILVDSITKIFESPIEVYNFVDLGANHNYFADGVLVHNSANPCTTAIGTDLPWQSATAKLKSPEDPGFIANRIKISGKDPDLIRIKDSKAVKRIIDWNTFREQFFGIDRGESMGKSALIGIDQNGEAYWFAVNSHIGGAQMVNPMYGDVKIKTFYRVIFSETENELTIGGLIDDAVSKEEAQKILESIRLIPNKIQALDFKETRRSSGQICNSEIAQFVFLGKAEPLNIEIILPTTTPAYVSPIACFR